MLRRFEGEDLQRCGWGDNKFNGGSLDICEFGWKIGKWEVWKGTVYWCIYIYTDVYTIIYIWQMNVHWMFFTSQDFLTVYCLDDCSVTIYSTTFWFTILSIILSDCFYTMCNTEGTYECTVFLWSRCWGYLFCLLEIRPIASWGIVFLHNGSPPGKTHVQTKHHPHLNWTSFWLSIL